MAGVITLRERVETTIERLAESHQHRWLDRDDAYWFQRLVQEVGELGSSLAGDHADTPEHELEQIASITINWLTKRALIPHAVGEEPRWQLTRARSALENWGRHFDWCESRNSSTTDAPRPCNCGLERELSALSGQSFMTKEWCLAMAQREADMAGAGEAEGRNSTDTPSASVPPNASAGSGELEQRWQNELQPHIDAAAQSDSRTVPPSVSQPPRESEIMRQIEWVRGLTLIHEDTKTMSYVKPSEYRQQVNALLDSVRAHLRAGEQQDAEGHKANVEIYERWPASIAPKLVVVVPDDWRAGSYVEVRPLAHRVPVSPGTRQDPTA